MNPVAFERRCIRSCCVVPQMPTKEYRIGRRGYPRGSISSGSGALLAPYLAVRLSRAPCRRGASTLSVLDRIHELKHSGDAACVPDISSSTS